MVCMLVIGSLLVKVLRSLVYGLILVWQVLEHTLPLFMKHCHFFLNLRSLLLLKAGNVSLDLKLDFNEG